MSCEPFSCFKPGKALCVGLSRIVESYPEQGGLGSRARMQLAVKLWSIFLDVTVHVLSKKLNGSLHYIKYDI